MASLKLPHLCGVLAFLALSVAAVAFPTRPIDGGELRARSEDAPRPEVLLDADGAAKLFRGRAAKLVILHAGPHWAGTNGHQGALWLVDVSRDPIEPVLVRTDAHRWIGDPAISPDGTRVVYHDGRHIYICRLEEGGGGATRIGAGYDPRWWVDPNSGDEYIIYVSTRWENSANVRGDTYIREVARGETRPVGERATLVHGYALRGGRSRDGRYMSTAQPGWVWAELHPTYTSDALKRVVDSRTGGHCNVSMGQDPAHPKRFLWLDGPHRRLYYDPATHASIKPLAPYREFTYTEWSTHADYLTASFYGAGIREFEPENHVVGVYDWAQQAWTRVARGAATHHLWVQETAVDGYRTRKALLFAAAAEHHTDAPAREWPVDRDGLILAWETTDRPAVVLDGGGNQASDVAYELAHEGRARYTREGAMRLEGGAFRADGLGDVLRRALDASGALTIEMLIRPRAAYSDEAKRFFYLGPSQAGVDPASAVMLTMSRGQVAFSADFAGSVEAEVAPGGPLRRDRLTHVHLELHQGGYNVSTGMAAGNGVAGGSFSGRPPLRVEPGHVIFGSDRWRGTIQAVAIYAKSKSAAGENAREHALRQTRRARVTVSDVTARLVRAPALPDPSQSAYKRAWAAFEYDIEQVYSGDVPTGRILVARYVWMDGETLPAATAELGDRHELLLEPYDANSHIHSERQFHLDDVDLDTPMFYDVGPLTED